MRSFSQSVGAGGITFVSRTKHSDGRKLCLSSVSRDFSTDSVMFACCSHVNGTLHVSAAAAASTGSALNTSPSLADA